ncbi:MAG TPA: tripartite tricarboxylate transporter substrate-binding protein [Reyranella sp.]|nr:tripartite tricarboxylate transporter substrate-binding protein [Reyranella sp.]
MIRLDRRACLALATASLLPKLSHADEPAIPDKAVRLIVGFGQGGGLDLTARLIQPRLEPRVGRRITVENKAGGIGAAAGEALKNGPNDGSQLALMPSTTIASRLFSNSFPFDPLTDVAPITTVGTFPMAIAVAPGIGVTSLEEYVAWLKQGDSDRRRMGSNALFDAFAQMYGKMFAKELGTPIDIVDYRSANSIIADLTDNRIPAVAAGLPTLLQYHRGGKVRILCVTSPKRAPTAPKIPTVHELGHPGLEMVEWYGFYTGGRAPERTIDAWNVHLRAIVDQKDMTFQLSELGLIVETSTPEAMKKRIVEHLQLWRERAQTLGFTAAK